MHSAVLNHNSKNDIRWILKGEIRESNKDGFEQA